MHEAIDIYETDTGGFRPDRTGAKTATGHGAGSDHATTGKKPCIGGEAGCVKGSGKKLVVRGICQLCGGRVVRRRRKPER